MAKIRRTFDYSGRKDLKFYQLSRKNQRKLDEQVAAEYVYSPSKSLSYREYLNKYIAEKSKCCLEEMKKSK